MDFFTQTTLVVGRIQTNTVSMLGTGFVVSTDGKIVTTRHVVGDNEKGLVILFPHLNKINDYQDTTDLSAKPVSCRIAEIDPVRDLAILALDGGFDGKLPIISGFDDVNVGEEVGIFGFPHCVQGRRVLTFQKTEVGAKVLLESNGVKSKHAVINTQTRPGQSGSLVFSPRLQKTVGILIGSYAPEGAGVIVAGINPHELNQTTHCISAEYIGDMV